MRLSRWGGLIIQRLSNTAQAINAGYINLLREQMKVSFEGWDIASATRMKRARIVHVIGGTLCFLDKLNSTILAQSKSSPESRGDSDVTNGISAPSGLRFSKASISGTAVAYGRNVDEDNALLFRCGIDEVRLCSIPVPDS